MTNAWLLGMVVDLDRQLRIIHFFEFLPAYVVYWASSLLALALIGVVVGYAHSLLRTGNPITALRWTMQGAIQGSWEILSLPLGYRRIWAMALLSCKEAIRRRVLYVFVLFLLPFLFAGWYLPNSDEGQMLFLVAFVTTAITWVLLPLVVFMTSMSLPADLKNRTIQTVVTKPIRRLELIVGRIIGFMLIFTAVLALMGGVSLLYLWGQLSPEARTRQWLARVPVYATSPQEGVPPLVFIKNGAAKAVGTNVGKEWDYRSHIEGASTAHWYFTFDPSVFNQSNVTCEFTFDIFKTTKGNPTRDSDEQSGVLAFIEFKDPVSKQTVYSKHHRVDNHRINTLADIPVDVMKNGKLEVIVQCVTRSQFLGMAQYDLYFLAGSDGFAFNFVKGLVAVWLKVLLLTCLAVSASTVLNGFVTALVTVVVYIVGTFYPFLMSVIRRDVPGGGPIESAIRLINQDNQTTDLEQTAGNRLALMIDRYVLTGMDMVSRVIPDLSQLDMTSYVAEGYAIPNAEFVRNILVVVAYVIPVVLVGYFLLKSRELAA